jgi:ribosome biogenesis GTPase
MRLEDLGYSDYFEKFRIENNLDGFEVGRIITEHKERFNVKTAKGEYDAEITGNMRFTARSREDFPAVGDWVALITYDPDLAIIHKIFPRYSTIKRQAVGRFGEIQIIATNVDYAFLLQSIDRDFNINRLERYLTICHDSNINPIIVISKIDLVDESRLDEILKITKSRINDIPTIAISNKTPNGFEALGRFITKGKTYCMLGSSGVGKSTLLNNLSDQNRMRTDTISESTSRGRHITSYRELTILENGGILIDNPGMREVGIASLTGGLEITFDTIIRYSKDCKFKDCTHTQEKGCSVLEAVEKGEIDKDSYENYIKMEREKAHFESTVVERRKKDKEFGKMMKNYKKDLKNKKQ